MSILFTPIKINGMVVSNRFMRSATNDRRADISGSIDDAFIKVYEDLAAGGVGLIVTGHAFVQWNGKASKYMLGVHKDDLIPGLKRLVEAVHQYDSRFVMQLNHAGRQTSSFTTGEIPKAPSAVINKVSGETPRPFTEREIEGLIEAYAAAAGRAKRAGFDGVQIHGAHGYLVNQFISPYTNRREDRWGGSLENRMRFPLELLRRIRREVGDDYPVMIKLNSQDFVEGGLVVEESARVAGALSREGIDAIEVSGGMIEVMSHVMPPRVRNEEDEGYYRANTKKIKEAVDVPVMMVAGLRSFGLMEKLVSEGEADMISMCRPFIRQPDLVAGWKRGDREKAACISCNGCQKYPDEPVRCIQLSA